MQNGFSWNLRKMFSNGLHLFGNAELPITAVAVGSQYNLTIMFHQPIDGRDFILNVQVGIDAAAPDQFQSVLLGMCLCPNNIFLACTSIVYQKNRLSVREMWEYRSKGCLAGDGEG
jgi:hypothetical protein